jgi:hypothetical protein
MEKDLKPEDYDLPDLAPSAGHGRQEPHDPAGLFSSIEVVALDEIFILEEFDLARAMPLTDAIARDEVLRNPVIVGRNGYGPLVQLDGANRLTALRELGCAHTVAQVVDYTHANITLDTWLHLVELDPHQAQQAADRWHNCRFEMMTSENALAALSQQQAAAIVVYVSGEALAVLTGLGLADRVRAMRQLTELYPPSIGRGVLDGADPLAHVRRILARKPRNSACVVFAPLSKGDVMTLVDMGLRLPGGVTRHVVNGRVLGVNAPLTLLQSKDLSAEEKTARLHDLPRGRPIRRYDEATVVYEDL